MLEGGKTMFKRPINAFKFSWRENVSIWRDHCTAMAPHWCLWVVPEPWVNQVWTGQDCRGSESVSDRPGLTSPWRSSAVPGRPREEGAEAAAGRTSQWRASKKTVKGEGGVKCSQGSRLRLRVIKWCQELKRHTHTHTLPLSLSSHLFDLDME